MEKGAFRAELTAPLSERARNGGEEGITLVEGHLIGLLANGTIATAYLAVAVLLAVNVTRTRQWFVNPLAAGTVFLYTTCGGGHAVYALQLLEASLGSTTAVAAGAKLLYADYHTWGLDVLTAFVGIWYWTMRRRFPDLVSGTAVFEDLRQRQRRALEINDNVVQGLVRAKMSFDLHRDEEARDALLTTMDASNRIVDELNSTGRPKEA